MPTPCIPAHTTVIVRLRLLLALATIVILATCDELPINSVGEVILHREGEIRISPVHKIGGYCWVTWYGAAVDKLTLRADETADDPPFHYRWELNAPGPNNHTVNRKWFADHCLEYGAT